MIAESTNKPASDTRDGSVESSTPESEVDRQAIERDYPDLLGSLPSLVDEAATGDVPTLHRAIAEYERVLTTVTEGNATSGGYSYTEFQFVYYEPLAEGLDAAAKTGGWDVLVEFTDAYNPHEQSGFPEVGHVIANALGRSIIHARQNANVDSIPLDALEFLGAIPTLVDKHHIAYEESYTYGWGIGHPDHSVGDHLIALAEDEPKFVKIALNTAFYVDQHAALAVFDTLVTDEDISGTYSTILSETDLTEFYFKALADLETEELLGPHAPWYYEDDDFPHVVDFDPNVKQRIRELADETGITDNLSSDWSLQDLEQGPMSEMLDMAETQDDNS